MGPRSTGPVGSFLLVCVVMFALPLLVAASAARRAGRAAPAGRTVVDRALGRLDSWREVVRDRGGPGPLGLPIALAAAGSVVLAALMVALGWLTKTAVVVRWDRPVYTFFLDHRGSALTHLMEVVTRIGQYPAMTGIGLSAATVVALGVARHRLALVVLLSAVLVPLLNGAGQLYNAVDVVALAVFGGAALVTGRRPFWAAALLMAAMPVEKRLQATVAGWVDGPVPALSTSLGHAGNFPSGGCTRIVLVAGLVAYVLAPGYARVTLGPVGGDERGVADRPGDGGAVARVWLTAMVVALAVLEALTRMYLGLHWAVDCLGGWLFGAGLLGIFVAVDRVLFGPLSRPPTGPDTAGRAARNAVRGRR